MSPHFDALRDGTVAMPEYQRPPGHPGSRVPCARCDGRRLTYIRLVRSQLFPRLFRLPTQEQIVFDPRTWSRRTLVRAPHSALSRSSSPPVRAVLRRRSGATGKSWLTEFARRRRRKGPISSAARHPARLRSPRGTGTIFRAAGRARCPGWSVTIPLTGLAPRGGAPRPDHPPSTLAPSAVPLSRSGGSSSTPRAQRPCRRRTAVRAPAMARAHSAQDYLCRGATRDGDARRHRARRRARTRPPRDRLPPCAAAHPRRLPARQAPSPRAGRLRDLPKHLFQPGYAVGFAHLYERQLVGGARRHWPARISGAISVGSRVTMEPPRRATAAPVRWHRHPPRRRGETAIALRLVRRGAPVGDDQPGGGID